MKEKKLYVCEICHTEYTDKVRAEKCETGHLPLDGLKIVGAKYYPLTMKARTPAWPPRITLQAPDGSTREYKG